MTERTPPFPPLDDRLARLGREWFADVRRNQPVEPAPVTRTDRGSGGDPGSGNAWDWLFAGPDDSCGDDGADGGGCDGD